MDVPTPIQRWHEIVERKDAAAIGALLADDCVFQSPAVHTPQRGRDVTVKYLSAALQVLNGERFRYAGQWFGDRSAVLEFETEVDGMSINGVDIIHWNEQGRIVGFKVMVRPLKGLQAVIPQMARLLQPAG